MIVAILAAAAGAIVLKSGRRGALALVLRAFGTLAFLAGSVWLVIFSMPLPQRAGISFVSLLATAVLIAGLAVEELIGGDVRRLFGL